MSRLHKKSTHSTRPAFNCIQELLTFIITISISSRWEWEVPRSKGPGDGIHMAPACSSNWFRLSQVFSYRNPTSDIIASLMSQLYCKFCYSEWVALVGTTVPVYGKCPRYELYSSVYTSSNTSPRFETDEFKIVSFLTHLNSSVWYWRIQIRQFALTHPNSSVLCTRFAWVH